MKMAAMAWKVTVGLGIAVVLSVCVASAAGADKSKEALSSAETWLSLVDGGKYVESWNEAAGYFKGAVKKEKWGSGIYLSPQRARKEPS
jgi:hypothetical protein